MLVLSHVFSQVESSAAGMLEKLTCTSTLSQRQHVELAQALQTINHCAEDDEAPSPRPPRPPRLPRNFCLARPRRPEAFSIARC